MRNFRENVQAQVANQGTEQEGSRFRLLNNRDYHKNGNEGVLSRNKGKEIFNGKYTRKDVGSLQKESLDLSKNNNNNGQDKEVGRFNNIGSNINGENGPISRSSLNKKQTKENLPDSKKQTSYLGLGDSSNAQARDTLDLPRSVTVAQQKDVVAGCSSSSMAVVDERLLSTGEMDLLLEFNSGSAQGYPVLEGCIRKEERLAVGNLDPERHTAVVFHDNLNPNKTNSLPNSSKGLILSIEQIAESLSALSKSNLELVEANVHGQIEGSYIPRHPDRSKLKLFWEDLQSIAPHNFTPWLMMGDFNDILSPADKMSHFTVATKEMEVRDELENILDHEDLLWRQKARCDWMQLGDRNTNFFHSRTIKRRKFNRVTSLRIENDEWCSDQDNLSIKAVEFFENLYDEAPPVLRDTPSSGFPSLNLSEISFLESTITNEEIKVALFDMAHLKAPRSDGFHAHFFQSQWNILGKDVCQWVKDVFDGK
ncbi:hypothetical protein PVK06_016337 [Gossypium arboreum]|uniref:Uncharacterized protein n=1 Tax=Gossypium arboreum TaxID=29729 RepID=A0ABR0Q041_GOSAR|nr:hypothetical protein PVK06_016337 [Gossypium arboreum]